MKVCVGIFVLSFAVVAFAEPPAESYLPPSHSSGRGNFRPSQTYGAPSQSYGAPSGDQGYESNEPAHYNFKYDVKDEHYGTDFGHEETREGDMTQGRYYVLLPDGRKQIVTYTADEHGYKPTIEYEEAQGGYGRGPANGGYPSGRPNGGHSSGGPY